MNEPIKNSSLRSEDGQWRGPIMHRWMALIGAGLLLASLGALSFTQIAQAIDSDEDTIPHLINGGYWLATLTFILSLAFLVFGLVCEMIAAIVFNHETECDEDQRLDELSGRSRFARGKKVYKYVRRALTTPRDQ